MLRGFWYKFGFKTRYKIGLIIINLGILGFLNLLCQNVYAQLSISLLTKTSLLDDVSFLSSQLESRTSINDLENKSKRSFRFEDLESSPLIWVDDISLIENKNSRLLPKVEWWIRRGGLLILTQRGILKKAQDLFSSIGGSSIKPVSLDSELMKSFYLLSSLPTCGVKEDWMVLMFDQRISGIIIPYNYLDILVGSTKSFRCKDGEKTLIRSFINIMMVALTTDYKNDQTHLPEILKRLR